jgi:iron complex transport system substrate-binding protein
MPGTEQSIGAAVSRRRFLGVAGMSAVVAAAAGAQLVPARAGAALARGDGGYPRTVKAANGRVRIPERPQRIVAGDNGTVFADLVALGVLPVVYSEWFKYGVDPFPWIAAADPGVDALPVLTTADPEPALEYDPDLFLFPAEDEAPLGLDAVAPLVVAPWDTWRRRQRIVAQAVDRVDRSNALLEQTDDAIVEAGARLGARADYRLDWISAYYSNGTKIYRYTSESTLSRLLREVGFPPLARGGEGGYEEFSLERAPELLDGDALVVEDWSRTPDQEIGTDDLLDSPLVQRSPAFRSGRVLRLSVDESIAGFAQSALSIPVVLAALERLP